MASFTCFICANSAGVELLHTDSKSEQIELGYFMCSFKWLKSTSTLRISTLSISSKKMRTKTIRS